MVSIKAMVYIVILLASNHLQIKDKFTSNMKGSLCILGSNRLQIMTLYDSADASLTPEYM